MKEELLSKPLPEWALKPHPAKRDMTVINPMAVIDRLNEVFGVGKWHFKTDFIKVEPAKMGQKDAFMSAVKGVLTIPAEDIHIEQYGGSTNSDYGDALKGGATDALTKIASYLGIGAAIYKNMGNVDLTPMTLEEALKKIGAVTSVEELTTTYTQLPENMRKDVEVIAKCKEVKEGLQEIIENK